MSTSEKEERREGRKKERTTNRRNRSILEVERFGVTEMTEVDGVDSIGSGGNDLWKEGRLSQKRKREARKREGEEKAHGWTFVPQQSPVDGKEPLVLLDFRSSRLRSQPTDLLLAEQFPNRRLAVTGEEKKRRDGIRNELRKGRDFEPERRRTSRQQGNQGR